jgi:hypothetical protein
VNEAPGGWTVGYNIEMDKVECNTQDIKKHFKIVHSCIIRLANIIKYNYKLMSING